MTEITLQHFLVTGAVLFSLGLFAVMTRRNAIAVLMGIELILNAANINFVAFSKYSAGGLSGQVFSVFVIVLAAAEAAVALAIILALYYNLKTIYVDEADRMRG